MIYKTGLLRSPAPPELMLHAYLLPAKIPPIPATFGHYNQVKNWGMLMNDRLGCCTCSGADHLEMAWCAAAGKAVRFTDLDVKDDYFAITGGRDKGADMVAVAKYWQQTGFRDAKAVRHKIGAYLQADPKNLMHIDFAAWRFGGVGLGVVVRNSDEQAFMRKEPWVVQNDKVVGYHYVPYLGRENGGNRKCVTWGGLQDMTEPWLEENLFEVVPIIGLDQLVNGKSPEGFDMAALQDDLDAISA